LQDGVKYYTTIRATTGCPTHGLLQSTSDGFVVDTTPPTMGAVILEPMYYKTKDSQLGTVSASWTGSDNTANTGENYVTYDVCVVPAPNGGCIENTLSSTGMLSTTETSLTNATLVAKLSQPSVNYLAVQVGNKAGLVGDVQSSRGLVVDFTPPSPALVECPAHTLEWEPVLCTWRPFADAESPVLQYILSFTSNSGAGSEDIFTKIITLNAQERLQYLIDPRLFGASDVEGFAKGTTYTFAVEAVSDAGLTSGAASSFFIMDATPPVAGIVEIFEDDKMLSVAQCQTSGTHVHVKWHSFVESESAVAFYEIAVGYSAGSEELRSFFSVGNISNALVSDFNEMASSTKNIYVSVRAVNTVNLIGAYAFAKVGVSSIDNVYYAEVVDGMGLDDIEYTTDDIVVTAHWNFSDPCQIVKY